jgi:hypothetical protein
MFKQAGVQFARDPVRKVDHHHFSVGVCFQMHGRLSGLNVRP